MGAVAILPPPMEELQVTGGSLVCAEQQWTLRLRLEKADRSAKPKRANLAIGREKFPAHVSLTGDYLTITIPQQTLEPLKAGSRLSLTEANGTRRIAAFALDGSRKAIEAIAPRCSPVNMSAYEEVMFSETDMAVGPARELLAGEIKLFQAATGKLPTLATTIIGIDTHTKLLFAKLCGPTNYYGQSGCNLTGYAPMGETGQWEEVYNTEGLRLYTDPKAFANGWPDLLTLPVNGPAEVNRWRWTKTGYALIDPIVAEDPAGSSDGNPQRSEANGTDSDIVGTGGNAVRPANRKALTPG